jgi:hypothetical protein
MKKTVLLILIVPFIFLSCTDNPAVNHAFVKYGHRQGVTSITVPGFVVRLAARIGDLEKDERELLRSIDKVKVLAVEDPHWNEDLDLHAEFYQTINKDHQYEELMHVKNDHESVTLFGKMTDAGVIREMVILTGGDDNVLVYLKGHFRADMLNKYIHKHEGDHFLSFDF